MPCPSTLAVRSRLAYSQGMSSMERQMDKNIFVTFNIVIRHIFLVIFIEISQVAQKIWRFSFSIFTIFINFPDFLTLRCNKETNGVSIKQMMSAILYFQPTQNRLLNNYIELNWFDNSSSWNMKEVRLTSPEKTAFKKQSCLIRVNLTKMKCSQNRVLKYIYIYIERERERERAHFLHFFTQQSPIYVLSAL